MKKIIFFVAANFIAVTAFTQFIYKIKADSVLITNDSCTAELNLENRTKDTLGFLYNKGKGRTEFRRGMIKLNDSTYLIGTDTLRLSASLSKLIAANGLTKTSDTIRLGGDLQNNTAINLKDKRIIYNLSDAAGSIAPSGGITISGARASYNGNDYLYIQSFQRPTTTGGSISAFLETFLEPTNTITSGGYTNYYSVHKSNNANINMPGASFYGFRTSFRITQPNQVFGNMYHFYGSVSPGPLAGMTNHYGLYLAPLKLPNTVGTYAIYTAGNEDSIYNAGPVRLTKYINNASEDSVLTTDINGNIKLKLASSGGSSNAWLLAGNLGTNPSNNFLGTNDGQRLVFRTNNIERATIDTLGNIGIGTAAPAYKLEVNGSIKNNGEVTFGNGTGYGWVMTGVNSIDQLFSYRASGAFVSALNGPLYLSGKAGNDVHVNRYIKINSDNDGLDGLILQPNSINTAAVNGTRDLTIGANQVNAMKIFQTGNIVVQTGGTYTDAGYKLDVTGSFRSTADANINNLTVGKGSGNMALNTVVGNGALAANTTGNYNTAIGYQALLSNTTGTINTAIGYASLLGNTIGNYNTAVGSNSLQSNTSGTGNTAVGYLALQLNQTGGNNTTVGYNSLKSNTTGNYNSALGRNALASSTTGDGNTAVGYVSLSFNTTGHSNTGIGFSSLPNSTTGIQNVALGANAMYFNNNGGQNTAIGTGSLYANTSGTGNTALGFDAIKSITTANNNIAIGHSAGSTLTDGTNNIFIGVSAQPNISTTGSNQLNIGNWIYGNNGSIGVGNSSPQYKLDITGTARVSSLPFLAGRDTVLTYDPATKQLMATKITTGGGGSSWNLTGNAGTNSGTNFLGTTDNVSLRMRTNNIQRAVIDSNGRVGVNTTAPVYQLDVNGDARINTLPFAAGRDTVLTYDPSSKQIKATLPTVPGTLIGIRVLSSGTSYTPTSGTKAILVQMVGGGGGGGGVTGVASSIGAAGGGGGGTYITKYVSGIGAGPYTYAIGAAGTAGTNTGGTGGTGGNTTFTVGATTYTAPGGSGGIGQTAGTAAAIILGGNGGAIGTNGDVNGAGQSGERGFRLSGTVGSSGNGGSSIFGGGGNARNTAGAGNAAVALGAGGGGALSTAATAQTGGAGSAGVIIIYEYK